MVGDEPFQLRDGVRLAAELQVGVDPVLERAEAQLLEARALGRREGLVCDVGERGSAPQPQRLVELRRRRRGIPGGERRAAVGDEPLEAMQVELAGEPQLIARGAGGDRVGAERLSQVDDAALQHLAGRRGR